MNLLKRFYIYQDERFPLKILFFTTIAVILSSAAILSYNVDFLQLTLAFISCIAYLFHIRVIDESRDYTHDLKFHPNRPVQRGLITIKQLSLFNIIGLAIFVFVSLYYGVASIVYGGCLLIFSYIAWKDFFLGKQLKDKFYLYNAVNMFQMVLLQMFIYSIFTFNFAMSKVMWIHLFFVIFNTIIMEFVRKIKISGEESKGEDTYSWHLGFKRSILVFYVFVVINFLTFLWMLYAISPTLNFFQLYAVVLFLILTIAVFLHLSKKSKKTESFLMLGTVLNYVGLNLLIYIF